MPPRKQPPTPKHKFNTDDLPTVDIELYEVPWYAVKSNDPNFSGHTFTGDSRESAVRVARSHATIFYKGTANVNIKIVE